MVVEYLSAREVKLAELRLLDAFDSYCRENGLRYSLAYGTLLGAVRHKGFIPWDDDVDVVMPVDDYKRFCAEFPGHCETDASRITIASRFNFRGPDAIPFEKLVDPNIAVKSGHIESSIREFVWLDIFPVASFSSEGEGRKIIEAVTRYKHLYQASRWSSSQPGPVGRLKAFAGCIARRTPLQQWSLKKMVGLLEDCTFASGGYVANIGWPVYGQRELVPGGLFDDLVEYTFEGKRYYGFGDFDCYLSSIYGDYMTLPPVNKRVSHELKAWHVGNQDGLMG